MTALHQQTVLCVRSSSVTNDDQQSTAMTAEYHSRTVDEYHTHSIGGCSAGARDGLTADGSDVLAMPT